MADVDDFFRLREYDSLGREVNELKSKMDEEVTRLKRRENEFAERQEAMKTRQSRHRDINHALSELDRRLAQHLSDEAKSKLEEEGLNLLVEQQQLEVEIDEDRTFLAGFEKTISEIKSDIDNALAEFRNKESVAKARAKSLAPQLPEGWLATYERILAKKPAHGVFSRIQGLHCQFCRYAVSKVLESEVDTQLQLKSCPGCGRLFLPHKTVAG